MLKAKKNLPENFEQVFFAFLLFILKINYICSNESSKINLNMKKIALFLGLYLIFGMVASSQITDAESKLKKVETDTVASWKKGGFSGLNFSQTSLTNWAAGGQNSLALNGLFNFFAVYKDTLNVWENTLDLGYGFLRQSSYDGIKRMTASNLTLNTGGKLSKIFTMRVYSISALSFHPDITIRTMWIKFRISWLPDICWQHWG